MWEKVRTWLSPPDPSINHNTACKLRHSETASWFSEGDSFNEWKKNGSLLWIRGNRKLLFSTHSALSLLIFSPILQLVLEKAFFGMQPLFCFLDRKFILLVSSAIIEDIKNTREATSVLIAYYYFDFKDASKRDLHGLLTSLLFQLGDDSDRCWDVLHELYAICRNGSEQPSDAALARCLQTMLELPGLLPVFIIMDALDECPNNTGTPSAREEVLNFVEELIGSNHSNLFVCTTSRPEQDIQAVLIPMTSVSHRVSLHEEGGQREDINSYVRSFVHKDRAMRRWREEDKELVITTLSERAGGM